MRNNERGMSLAEVLAGLAILSTLIVATLTVTTTALHQTKNNINKEFGTQKAISMLEELRSLVQASNANTLTFLDAFDDGTKNQVVLTTQGQKATASAAAWSTLPDDAISGNMPGPNGKWLYERRISVQPVPGQGADVRFVNVKVFINEQSGQRLLAEVASVLRTLVVDMPSSQVYDVYAVAVENVPGWWVYMSNIVPFVRSTINDLQSRHPGLIFRTHWINTLSYGRDEQYLPYINDKTAAGVDVPSTSDIDWAYFYPGRMPPLAANLIGDDYYYPPSMFRGRISKDGTTINTFDAAKNPWPYALADQFNASMRYDDEKARYDKRKLANPDEEPTWRLLIEQMYSNPSKYTNAIVINLHGELLPFPPVRNYADAAKSPETYPNVRAVTHPEQLRYLNTDPVTLRLYTFKTNPAVGDSYFGQTGLAVPISVKISGLNGVWTPAASDVQYIRGGTDQEPADATPDTYDAVPVNAQTSAGAGGNVKRMYYTAGSAGADTLLRFYYSPLSTPQSVAGGPGLNTRSRLYGQDYIPAPLEDLSAANVSAPFTRHIGWWPRSVRDDFSTNAYTRNDGLTNWNGNWIETGDDSAPTTGLITVSAGQMVLTDNGAGPTSSLARGVDLTGYLKAKLTMTYLTSAGVAAADNVRLEISTNGGGTWTTVNTFTGPKAAATIYSVDITPYISATTQIRFISGAGYTTSAKQFDVQSVQIADLGSGDTPKNTARWVMRIPVAMFANDREITIETRIGDDLTTGVMWPAANVPPNLSKTYCWRGDDTWIFGDLANGKNPNLPITETFQYLGDPRHLPYADLKRPHIGAGTGGTESRLGLGYNRYFDDFESWSDGDGNGVPDGNAAAAEIIAGNTENYVTTAAAHFFAASFDGNPSISVDLTAGTMTAVSLATKLNSDATFKTVGEADVIAIGAVKRLRVRSKNRTQHGSVQFDTAVASHANSILGFPTAVAGVPWPGWQYTSGGVIFGVKNNDHVVFDPTKSNTYDGSGNAAGYQTDDGWSNAVELDVHRGYQMVRSALIQSSVLWTTMTGYSYYYMGIGNEIGYDCANGFGKSIPLSTKPFTGVSGGTHQEQTILPSINVSATPCDSTKCVQAPDICDASGCGVKYIREQAANGWWSVSWLGELYPDSQYASSWKTSGNLPTGTGAAKYVRAPRDTMPLFFGTDLTKSQRRTAGRGVTTLFWGETVTAGSPAVGGKAMHHEGVNGTATLFSPAGDDIANNYDLPVPKSIDANRPWQADWVNTGNEPENFLSGPYPAANQLQMLQQYYTRDQDISTLQGWCYDANNDGIADTYTTCLDTTPKDNKPDTPCGAQPAIGGQPTEASGLLAMTDSTQRPAFVVVNGLSPTGITGTTFIAKWSFLTLIQSFLNGGMYSDTKAPLASPANRYHIRQLPRILISSVVDQAGKTELKDPSSVTVAWTTTFKRWDGLKYSAAYPAAGYTPDYTTKYVVLYSPTNGAPDPVNGNPTGWLYTDGSSAPVGAGDLAKAIPDPATPNSGGSITLNTPKATFPEGNYLLRVEAYRPGYTLHYSFHQYRAYIQRQ
jgi:type II secretory pathway pseudopilin PulG